MKYFIKKKRKKNENFRSWGQRKRIRKEQKEETNVEGRYSRSSVELMKVTWRVLVQRRQQKASCSDSHFRCS